MLRGMKNPLQARIVEWLREECPAANLMAPGYAFANTLEIATALGEAPDAVRRACQALRRRNVLTIRGRVGYGGNRHEADPRRVGWEQWEIHWDEPDVPLRVKFPLE